MGRLGAGTAQGQRCTSRDSCFSHPLDPPKINRPSKIPESTKFQTSHMETLRMLNRITPWDSRREIRAPISFHKSSSWC